MWKDELYVYNRSRVELKTFVKYIEAYNIYSLIEVGFYIICVLIRNTKHV